MSSQDKASVLRSDEPSLSSDIQIPSSPPPTQQRLQNDANEAQQTSMAPPTQPANPRLAALAAKQAKAEATLAELQATRSALVDQATLPSGLAMPDDWSEEQKTKHALTSANAVIKEHIALLHKYNEIKDIGQGLMGLIADSRGVRISEVMEDFGVAEKD